MVSTIGEGDSVVDVHHDVVVENGTAPEAAIIFDVVFCPVGVKLIHRKFFNGGVGLKGASALFGGSPCFG